jgi:hypothetical protein
VLPALDAGGVERGTLEIGRALVAEGHRSIVVSSGGRLESTLRAEGSEHVTLGVGVKSPLTFLRCVPPARSARVDTPPTSSTYEVVCPLGSLGGRGAAWIPRHGPAS